MNKVAVEDDMVIVEPLGMDKLWSLRSALRIPLAHVRAAAVDAEVAREPRGLRAPGTRLPGKTAGTFRRNGAKTFWNVSHPLDNVVIDLAGDEFQRIVVTVADPAAVERALNDALAGHPTTPAAGPSS